MKVKELVNKAKDEIESENEKIIVKEIKDSLKDIAAAERTLAKLKKVHKKFLDTDVDDVIEKIDSRRY